MQPAPIGAQCALHPGVSASTVCARCGNFMCTTCTDNGAQTQCPSCRALAPEGFPFNAESTLSDLWNHALEVFKRDPAMMVVGAIVFFGISMAGGIVANIISSIVQSAMGVAIDQRNPLKDLGNFVVAMGVAQAVSMAVQVVVQAAALSGYYRFLMDALIGRKADIGRIFSKLKDLGKFVLLQVLMIALVQVPLILMMGVVAIVGLRFAGFDWNNPSAFRFEMLVKPEVLGLFSGSFVLLFVVSVVLLPISLFSLPELVVGNCTPMEAIRRSWQLGDGQRLRLFGYGIVVVLITFAGLIACCVGLLAAVPLSYLLLLGLFLALRNSSTLPPVDHS